MGLSLSRRAARVAGNYAGILARAVRGKRRRAPPMSAAARDAKRILIVRCDHIGDAFMSVPAIAWVRQAFPNAHIALMVASWSSPLFEGSPLVDELIVHDPPWWTKRRQARFGTAGLNRASMSKLLGVISSLRAEPFDLCIELRGDPRQMLAYGYLAQARFVLSRDRHGATGFADFAPSIDESLHEVEQNLQLVRHLASDGRFPETPLTFTFPAPMDDADRGKVRALLRHGTRHTENGGLTIVAHPGAKHVNQWPAAYWREWVRRMAAWGGPSMRILLTGGPGEGLLCETIAQDEPSVTVLAGKLSLRETAALMELSDLVVIGDTGPMHLLNAVHTPAILLFGPTPPSRYAPQGAHVEIMQGKACCVTGNHEECLWSKAPAPSTCMASIPPSAVLERAQRTLTTRAIAAGTPPAVYP